MENSEILKTQDLTYNYQTDAETVSAINNVTFSAKKSQFVAITGRSGSGKTTLLHLIAGLIKPNAGKIFIEDNEITSLNDETMTIYRRRNIGLVFQNYNLVEHLNVKDNILLPVNLDSASVDEDLFWNIIDSLNLKEKLNKKPNQLSGGEQQRVSIARAMMIKPLLLLADEPTGNLDKKTGEDVFGLFSLMQDLFGQTVILATHDETMAGRADMILQLEDGRLAT